MDIVSTLRRKMRRFFARPQDHDLRVQNVQNQVSLRSSAGALVEILGALVEILIFLLTRYESGQNLDLHLR